MKLIQTYTFYFFILVISMQCVPNLSRDLANIAYISYLIRLPKSDSSSNSVPVTQSIQGSITITPTAGLMTSESGLTASFTVVLNSAPTAIVTIPISSSNVAEGEVNASNLVFTSANYNTPQTVFISGVNDSVADGIISYKILTGNAISTDTNYNGLDPSDVDVINVDNDSAGITVSAISGNTNESGLTASFTIVLNSPPTAIVTIPISSSNIAEGTASASSLVFTSANYNTPQTVFISGVNDSVADGIISYKILTGNAISTDTNYNGLDPSDVDVINVDNDSAGITVSAISGNTDEAGATANFTVVLTSSPSSNVTIPISSSNIAEGTVSVSSLVFTPVNWNIPQMVTVTGVNDSVADGNINYSILTNAATSSDANYNGINPPDLSLTNFDVGEKRTFISSTALIGNIGGISGADTLCNSDAAKPSISPNVYKAMIVDGTNRKASTTANVGDGQIDWVLLPNTTYFRVDGTTQVMTTNANGIFVFGALTNSFLTTMTSYWTGLNANWTTFGTHCTGWTTTGGNSRVGDGTPTNGNSITGMANVPCSTSGPHLLCIQQ